MHRKKILWLIVLVVIASGAWYGYKEFTRTNKDLSKVKPDVKISATDLIKEFEFESDDSVSLNKKYTDNIIEITGNIQAINKDEHGDYTIMLGDNNNSSSVQCEMDTTHQQDAAQLANGSSVIIRGHFVGFQKGETILDVPLGSTVSLNRSVIVKKK